MMNIDCHLLDFGPVGQRGACSSFSCSLLWFSWGFDSVALWALDLMQENMELILKEQKNISFIQKSKLREKCNLLQENCILKHKDWEKVKQNNEPKLAATRRMSRRSTLSLNG